MMLTPSLASAGWTAPVIVSGAGTSTSQTRIAGGTEGASWVVWKRQVGGFDVIQGTLVQTDGSQGPIQPLSTPGADATDPVIATRADGSAMVAWLNQSAADDTVESRSIAADGTLGAITVRSAAGPAGQPASDIALDLGDDGSAALTWRKFDGANWIAQAVKVAANGASGTIHNLSDPSASVGPPAVAAIPPTVAGDPISYRTLWPQGTGAGSNVGNRDLFADDTVSDLVLVFANGEECQDPFDAYVTYGSGRSMNAFWVCYRDTMDLGTSFSNWSVQWLQLGPSLPITTGANVVNASPTVINQPYKINSLYATETFGGEPAVAWVHELEGGGGERVETWRVRSDGNGQGWDNTPPVAPSVEDPVIAANASPAAIAGGVEQGPLPGETTVSWARFSFSAFEPSTPSGAFTYTDDPGFVMADDGKTLAAFTGIDGGNVGTTYVMAFDDPGLAVSPGSFNFGSVYIGRSSPVSITVRSSGETSNEVTGITLSGAGAGSYQLSGADSCVRTMLSGTNCRFEVRFKPGSTATQTAKVTVTSDAGVSETNLTGSGLNRTTNRLTVSPRRKAVRKGTVVRLAVRAANVGGVASTSTRVCARLNQRALRLAGNRCRSIGSLPAGASRTLNFRVRVTWRVRKGARLPVTFQMRSGNAVVRQAVASVIRKRR